MKNHCKHWLILIDSDQPLIKKHLILPSLGLLSHPQSATIDTKKRETQTSPAAFDIHPWCMCPSIPAIIAQGGKPAVLNSLISCSHVASYSWVFDVSRRSSCIWREMFDLPYCADMKGCFASCRISPRLQFWTLIKAAKPVLWGKDRKAHRWQWVVWNTLLPHGSCEDPTVADTINEGWALQLDFTMCIFLP